MLIPFFTLQSRSSKQLKTWMRDEHSIAMPQFQAVVSLTVFVALGNCYSKPLFMVSEEGTSAAMTKKFLALMLESRSEQTKNRPLRIILDGKSLE